MNSFEIIENACIKIGEVASDTTKTPSLEVFGILNKSWHTILDESEKISTLLTEVREMVIELRDMGYVEKHDGDDTFLIFNILTKLKEVKPEGGGE